MDALPTAERDKLAHRFDRYARHSAVALLPIAVIALVDLATSSLLDDWRLDIGLLAAAALGLSGTVSLRRLARRLRSGEVPHRSTPALWVRAVTSTVASLDVSGGVGYLVGGTVLAIALPLATILLVGVSVGLGLRRRRRMSDDLRGL